MNSRELGRSYETDTAQQAIDAITQRELDPRHIDDYAEDALRDLIEVVSTVTRDYSQTESSGIERERAALTDAGLDPMVIEQTLDHIANVADSIQSYDQLLVRKTHPTNRVILPPNSDRKKDIAPGDGSFEKPKELVPKLRTLLLVLDKVFNIDVRDDEAVRIESGIIRPDMMRGASYSVVSIPELVRTVFACDEIGNTTFVFDSTLCEEKGNNLHDKTKDDLRDLIDEYPSLGIQIDYSKQYANHLVEALQEPFGSRSNNKNVAVDNNNYKYILQPNIKLAPEGYLSLQGIANELGIASQTAKKAVDQLSEKLGVVGQYKFGTTPAYGYSPNQVEMIHAHIGESMAEQKAPEGHLSILGIAKQLGVYHGTVSKAIAEINNELGVVKRYKFRSRTVSGYSPEQIEMICTHINRYAEIESAPDGYMSMNQIAKQFHTAYETLREVLSKMDNEFGEVKRYKFRRVIADGYSPEQIEMIQKHLNKHNDYLSKYRIAKRLGAGHETISRAISEIGEDFGEIHRYRYSQRWVDGYSPEQVEMIRLHLKK